MKTFPKETHGIVEYRTFVNNFKKIVTNMQSLGKKSAEKEALEVFSTDKMNDRRIPHKIFNCQVCFFLQKIQKTK